VAEGIRYYVEKAFPKDQEMLKEFGFAQWRAVRYKQQSVIIWMLVLHNRAKKYETELLAEGLSAAAIAGVEAQAQAPQAAEVQQEAFKRERLATTRRRVRLQNELTALAQRVSQAARLIWPDEPEKAGLFKVEPK